MTLAPTQVSAEMLRVEPVSMRAKHWLLTMQQAGQKLGIRTIQSDHRVGGHPWLFLWGPGHPSRIGPMQDQIASGGHVIACDLAYWERNDKVRIAIDAAHPQHHVLAKDWPRSRFLHDAVPVLNTWKADGPIIIAGVGPKAVTQYGAAVEEWERTMVRACAQRYPNRLLLYKPKKPMQEGMAGAQTNRWPIDQLLTGASLLITWHSNCAVDAIRHGVPAICRDGAAAAVCPADLPAFGDPQPLEPALRDRFLGNLAWFQWAPSEAASCWRWLLDLLA